MNQMWAKSKVESHGIPQGEIMSYGGLLLMPGYDREHDCLAENFWYIAHEATGNTVTIITAGADRARVIASRIAALCNWPDVASFSWEGDDRLEALIAEFPGEAQISLYDDEFGDDLDAIVPYGSN